MIFSENRYPLSGIMLYDDTSSFLKPMNSRIHTEADLGAALSSLVAIDARFAQALAISGRPPLRRRPDGFSGLASIIVSQQLSTASANAIWSRLNARFDPFDTAA